jgi:hypothetical protein
MWKNLAPDLIRQRVIIEGTTEKIIEPEQIKQYLNALADFCKMEKLADPEAHSLMTWVMVDGFIGRRPVRHSIAILRTHRFSP